MGAQPGAGVGHARAVEEHQHTCRGGEAGREQHPARVRVHITDQGGDEAGPSELSRYYSKTFMPVPSKLIQTNKQAGAELSQAQDS